MTVIAGISLYPNVPQLPGVPQLVRSLLFPASPAPTLGTQVNGNLWAASQANPGWAVLGPDGTVALSPDSIYQLEDRQEYRIPDFPIQKGSFASYNKVVCPEETSVRMNKGSSLADRQAFLNTLKRITGDLNLYTIITPEVSYINCNIMRRELIRRSSEGAYFIEVDVYFRQVNTVTAQYSYSLPDTTNAQNPSAVPSVNQGLVQSQAAGSAATSAAGNALSQTPF